MRMPLGLGSCQRCTTTPTLFSAPVLFIEYGIPRSDSMVCTMEGTTTDPQKCVWRTSMLSLCISPKCFMRRSLRCTYSAACVHTALYYVATHVAVESVARTAVVICAATRAAAPNVAIDSLCSMTFLG